MQKKEIFIVTLASFIILSTLTILAVYFSIPKIAKANPACVVNDDLQVANNLNVQQAITGGFCKTVVGGCLQGGGETNGSYGGAASSACQKDQDVAGVMCPLGGYWIVGGGCRDAAGNNATLQDSCPTNTIEHDPAFGGDGNYSCEDSDVSVLGGMYTVGSVIMALARTGRQPMLFVANLLRN